MSPVSIGVMASSAAWIPSNLPNLIAWWDADYASSFTYSSGTSVSSWASRVGSYSMAQTTSTKQPTRSGSVNGRSSVVFNGTSHSMSAANVDMSGGQKWTVWGVFTSTSGSVQIMLEHTANYNSTQGAWAWYRESTDKVTWAKFSSSAYSVWTSSLTVTTTPRIAVGTHDGTLSTNETSGWIDNDGSGTRPLNGNSNVNNVKADLFLGARNNSSVYLNGQVCEFGIMTDAISTADRSSLQTYLASKWGITL